MSSKSCYRSGVHAAGKVASDFHITDELPLDSLLEKPVKFFTAGCDIGNCWVFLEIVVPITGYVQMLTALQRQIGVTARRENGYPLKQCLLGNDILKGKIFYQARRI